jgi:hypothetical protein
MLNRVFAMFMIGVVASALLCLSTLFGVASQESAEASNDLQTTLGMVAPVNLPASSDRQCSASVVVSVTVVNPDWHE